MPGWCLALVYYKLFARYVCHYFFFLYLHRARVSFKSELIAPYDRYFFSESLEESDCRQSAHREVNSLQDGYIKGFHASSDKKLD